MKNDGGRAFPAAHMQILGAKDSELGMTLRDYFAAAALQGTMKDRGNLRALALVADERKEDIGEFIAARMYSLADAMLAERDK